ncbi:SHQ1 protein-domain-containing protein [Cladochytrium replicatum]|nr:SHQ1 protein-domain-containing protein [Cladochytrium replicatum]
MLVPQFSISQTPDFVVLELRCPFIKSQDVEIDVDGNEFKFHARPYFLRLTFPHALVEDGREESAYDVATGAVFLKIPKETPGQEFPDLDLLTSLISKSAGKSTEQSGMSVPGGSIRPLIEVLGGTEEEAEEYQRKFPEIDWNNPYDGTPADEDEPKLELNSKYGFNNQYSGFQSYFREMARAIIDIDDIDRSTPASRREERIANEDLKFDPEYYFFDMKEDEEIQRLILFKPDTWKSLKKKQEARGEGADITEAQLFGEFTDRENDMMRKLPNKQYILDDERAIYLSMIDIMFGYCYNYRTMEGQNTVESPWTIAKLSATLSCFETFSSIKESLQSCVRRSLSYPLYRNFELSLKIVDDVIVYFKLGRRFLLRAFLEIKNIFDGDETSSALNRLFIDDYCIWLQKASDHTIRSLASELNHIKITKEDVGWPLIEIEQWRLEDVDDDEKEGTSEHNMEVQSDMAAGYLEPTGGQTQQQRQLIVEMNSKNVVEEDLMELV